MILLRRFSFYLALLGLVVAGSFVWKVMQPRPKSVPLAQPAANPYKRSVAASGIVEAQDRNIEIGSPVSGLIEDYLVKVGQKVERGDVLFIIDGRDLRASLQVQQTEVEVAKAKEELLQDQLQRLEKVKDQRAISIDEVKTKYFNVKVAQTELMAAEAKVQEIKALLDRLVIRAPRQGVIIQNSLRVGEYFQAGGAKPAMVLGNHEQLQIRADIDEQNAAEMILGAKATAFPRNNTSLAIPLKFSYIEPYVIPKRSLTGASQERVDTRVLQVIYQVEQPLEFPLYIGQQVDVFIDLETKE